MSFKEYPKIHRLGAEENEGILDDGLCIIQEKVDGANTSIWMEDGVMKFASRKHEITEGFNGFIEYAKQHKGILALLKEAPDLRLYGEWLVRHTISYNETMYKHFYLFDLWDEKNKMFLTAELTAGIAEEYGIRAPQIFAKIEKPTIEQINEFVGKTNLGEKGEGVVIKNTHFVNKFGDHSYAKVVTQEFKEENSVAFGGNNKHSETYWEQYVVNEYINEARVRKVMNKVQPLVEKKLDMEHTARIIQTVYHDMITEEIWTIAKKVTGNFSFKSLERISAKKAARVYHDVLNGLTTGIIKEEV